MSWLVGIDPGTRRIGIAILGDDGYIHTDCMRPGDGPTYMRVHAAFDWTLTVLSSIVHLGLDPDDYTIGVETSYGPRGVEVAVARGAIYAAIGECAWPGMRVVDVTPTQAKKALLGTGRATKQDMRAAVLRRFGVRVSADAADAVGIALAAKAVV